MGVSELSAMSNGNYMASGNGRDTFISRTDQVRLGRGDNGGRGDPSTHSRYTGCQHTPRGQRATGMALRHAKVVSGDQQTTASVYGEFYAQGAPRRPEVVVAKDEKAFSVAKHPPSVSLTPRQIQNRSSFSGMALTIRP